MVPLRRTLASSLLVVCLASVSSTAISAALRQGKATDDSVCDLGPDTTYLIGRKVLVPASARSDLAADAYFRFATRFIASNCAQGQALVLHAADARALDSRYLPEVANVVCAVADVQRTPTTKRNEITNRDEQGFELRCRMTKFEQFKADVQEREKSNPTDAFILGLQSQAPSETAGETPASHAGVGKKDCGKMTLSSVMMSGNCK